MGAADVNLVVGPHHRTGVLRGYKVYVHLGSANILGDSDDATISDYAAFRAGALANVSDSALDALGETAWGTWYKTYVENVTDARDQLRRGAKLVGVP